MTHCVATRMAALALLAAACGGGGSKTPETTLPAVQAELPEDSAAKPAPPPRSGKPKKTVTLAEVGLDLTNLDKNANACEDFYQYACGGWLAKNEIPADRARHGNFSILNDQTKEKVRQIIEQAGKEPGGDPVKKKIGDYYGACMDEAAVERAGLTPIQPLLGKIRAATNVKALQAALVELHKARIWVVFDVASGQDEREATSVIAQLDQNGLGLPNREYYVGDSPRYAEIRKKYEEHIGRMLTLAGTPKAAALKQAAQVLQVETELAKIQKTPVERRDPEKMYNKIDRVGVAKAAPQIGWDAYFAGVGIPSVQAINVTSPEYFTGVGKLLTTLPVDAWRAYFTYQVLVEMSEYLPKRFVDEGFVRDQLVSGQPKQEARWERCVASASRAITHLIAQPFVAQYYGADSEKATTEMVKGIREAMRQGLQQLPWMDGKTRERAQAKLEKMTFNMGYPKKWREYTFAIDRKNPAKNWLAAQRFETKRNLDKIGKPVDREDWWMSPATVNASYSPNLNTMTFPAAILAPPFLNPKASVAVNLGGMGMVVGHELTHGFDDQGAQYDLDGNLKNWWEPKVGEEFKKRTKCVSDQYAQYSVEGEKVNGDLTLGENIADIGGLKIAFGAYRQLRADAEEELVADGFTEDQQFFLGTAQIWCSKDRPEHAKQRLVSDPHSPPRYRINGTLQATPAFQQAFSCKPGQGMVPKKRCEVW
jgi:putative endopeptidase